MRGLILAGGRGSRLEPITLEMPKAMVPFKGKPLIEQSVYTYWKYAIWEIWLSVSSYKVNQIIDKYPYPAIFEQKPMGTGGWIKLIKDDNTLLNTFKQDHFFVNNADNLLSYNLLKMLEQHKKDENLVTIACTKVDDVREYGSVTIKTNKITHFKEKQQSPKPKQGYINTGYYIFSPKFFEEIELPASEQISLEKDIFPKIARMGKLGAYIEENAQWFDTGTMDRYKKAIMEWKGE